MAGGSGDWLLIEEFLERGDPAFVDALRACHDAERLAAFAARWYAERRPASRRLLLEYLDRPLNAFRHEPLVKRLFRLAEAAGDDEVTGRFLVLFDRSIRRARRRRAHPEWRTLDTAEEALAEAWRAEGYAPVHVYTNWNRKQMVSGTWCDEWSAPRFLVQA